MVEQQIRKLLGESSKSVDNMVESEYNMGETKKVSVWRHVKAVLRLGRLITGTL